LRPQAGFIEVLQDNAVVDATVARRSIAIVPQEPFLFAGTFFENITFGREWVTRNEVQRAATAARIHDHIMQHLDGYDGEVEERGQNLSRGQRQRLSIARALVGSPSVLVLDEATSSLDVVSERAIKCLLEELRGEVTIVIIAHQGEQSRQHRTTSLGTGPERHEGRPECINVWENWPLHAGCDQRLFQVNLECG
jgi:ABC-type multidrug transport system fused ATPase/permease subunit